MLPSRCEFWLGRELIMERLALCHVRFTPKCRTTQCLALPGRASCGLAPHLFAYAAGYSMTQRELAGRTEVLLI